MVHVLDAVLLEHRVLGDEAERAAQQRVQHHGLLAAHLIPAEHQQKPYILKRENGTHRVQRIYQGAPRKVADDADIDRSR